MGAQFPGKHGKDMHMAFICMVIMQTCNPLHRLSNKLTYANHGFFCYFLGSFLAIRVSPEALWIAYSAAMLYGTGFGWTFICLNTVTGHYYGPAAFPKVNGMLLVLAAIFCSPAGYLGGRLFDLYHSYKLAFEVNSALAAMGIVALFFARMPEAPEARIPVRG